MAADKIQALSNVNVTLEKGELIGIVGASGSGKSTLAKIFVYLYKPTSGSVYFMDNNITGYNSRKIKKYRREIQMVFQDPYASLDPNHSVEWHIKRPLILSKYSGNVDHRINELLNMVTLNPEYRAKFPHQLSGGQRQRVYLARALAVNPKILIADEPVSMLDVSVRIEILTLLQGIKNKLGISIIYITHDLNTVSMITDRLYVMQEGRVVEEGFTDSIINNPSNEYTKKLIEAAPNPYKRI
jgi:peptide/nickel transport system ATP-binding protein